MGGSTNTVLHTLALAHEAGVDYPIARLNEVAERVPNICKVSPSSSYHIEDVERAGGVSAILWELFKRPGILHGDAMTVTGKTLRENVQGAESQDQAVIRPLSNPYSEHGGLAILFGNLAPEGGVVKAAGILPEMMRHRGPAVVFDSHDEANAGILNGKVKAGDVVVIRYEGPKGGPGMQEMLAPTSNIMGMGLGTSVALITDGRFSGATPRRMHRPRLPGGGRGRPHRPDPRWRHDHARHPGAAAGGRGVGRGAGAPPGRVAAGAAGAVRLAEALRGDGHIGEPGRGIVGVM